MRHPTSCPRLVAAAFAVALGGTVLPACRDIAHPPGARPNSSPLFARAVKHKLNVAPMGSGGGTVTSSSKSVKINCTLSGGSVTGTCTENLNAATVVSLQATAASGSSFTGWSGSCSGTGTCEITMSADKSVSATFTASAPPPPTSPAATVGQWSPVSTWPLMPIHAHVLPSGKVLAWGGTHGGTNYDLEKAVLWTPATNVFQPKDNTTTDVFCAGHSFLANGDLLVSGGHIESERGLKRTNVFHWQSETWSYKPEWDMAKGRWYPTNTTLADGSVITMSGDDEIGNPDGTAAKVLIPEMWTGSGWRQLSSAARQLPYFPMNFMAPNGKLFTAGPQSLTNYLDFTGNGSWGTGRHTSLGNFREYGTAVMYASGKILLVGGGDPPTKHAEIIDLGQNPTMSSTEPGWQPVAQMHYARRHLHATVLPNGKVFVTGGTDAPGFNTGPGVLQTELWDPVSKGWAVMASMSRPRLYHSMALLLPDGRVLAGGGGREPAPGLVDEVNVEIYSPPYLFNPDGTPATRPSISSAPATVAYGASFTITMGGAMEAQGSRVTLVRLSSVTHSTNMDQRLHELTPAPSTGSTSTFSVTLPGNRNLLPPGYYLLFVLNNSGVPSVGRMLQIL